MNKWLEIFLGLILIAGAVYSWGMNLYGFGDATLTFLKGGVIWFIIMISLLLIMLGITDIKDD